MNTPTTHIDLFNDTLLMLRCTENYTLPSSRNGLFVAALTPLIALGEDTVYAFFKWMVGNRTMPPCFEYGYAWATLRVIGASKPVERLIKERWFRNDVSDECISDFFTGDPTWDGSGNYPLLWERVVACMHPGYVDSANTPGSEHLLEILLAYVDYDKLCSDRDAIDLLNGTHEREESHWTMVVRTRAYGEHPEVF